jgi:cytochrome c-type biogenesis protein
LGGAVIVLFGLYLLGVVRVPFLMQERRVQLGSKPAGMLGSVIAGVAFGAGWTPCIGPVLASILLYAGVSATVLQGATLLTAYAIGLGIPFFVAAVAFNWFLSRTRALRPWLRPIERAAGVVMIIAGGLLFTGRFAVLSRMFAV